MYAAEEPAPMVPEDGLLRALAERQERVREAQLMGRRVATQKDEPLARVECGLVRGVGEEEHSGGSQQLCTIRRRAIAGGVPGADGTETRDGLEVGFVCELVWHAEVVVDEEEGGVLGWSVYEPF